MRLKPQSRALLAKMCFSHACGSTAEIHNGGVNAAVNVALGGTDADSGKLCLQKHYQLHGKAVT